MKGERRQRHLRANKFYMAESISHIDFRQHENLLGEEVVIQATNNFNQEKQTTKQNGRSTY